jgi:hypothetical protein
VIAEAPKASGLLQRIILPRFCFSIGISLTTFHHSPEPIVDDSGKRGILCTPLIGRRLVPRLVPTSGADSGAGL